MIDRVVPKLGGGICEVPVVFKWLARGLLDGSCCFAGEESAGACFLRRDGTVWTPDKDGLIMSLLGCEIAARTGREPGERFRGVTAEFGIPCHIHLDSAATPEQRARLKMLSQRAVKESTLTGDSITAKLTQAPGNNAPLGGRKVVTAKGWFDARPSGTEDIYKIYAESFRDESHQEDIVTEARELVDHALTS